MRFDWHPGKARINLAKHGVSFTLAQRVWDDPLHVIVEDGWMGGEQRWRAIGMVGAMALLVVAHAYPQGEEEPHVRIISARKATANERRRFEQDTS